MKPASSASTSPTGAPLKSAVKSSAHGNVTIVDMKRPQDKSRSGDTSSRARASIDPDADRWPYCIVWTPLPFVTWFVPTIGHTGVANSRGLIYDFSDDFKVSVDNFSFGTPSKYYQFRPSLVHGHAHNYVAWDRAIEAASEHYSRTRHSLFFNNCHQYIADVLNRVKYDGRTSWTQTEVWWLITFRSRYVGWAGFARQWAPFGAIALALIVLLVALFT